MLFIQTRIGYLVMANPGIAYAGKVPDAVKHASAFEAVPGL